MREILIATLIAGGCYAGGARPARNGAPSMYNGLDLNSGVYTETVDGERQALMHALSRYPAAVGRVRARPKGGIAAQAETPRVDALGGGVQERLVVYNGTLVVRAADLDDALKRAREIVKRLGGWMQSMKRGEATFRVPARTFEEAMDLFAALGVVVDRAISGADVTEEYRDLELRLRNARALREKLAALLKRAEKVEEALKVEKELARVTEEIERLEGKLRVLADRIAYSTITLKLVKRPPERARRAAWTPFGWVRRLGAGRLFFY